MANAPSSKPSSKWKAPSEPPVRAPKRLVFDRRYGWIVDEWRDPSEEALAGGRGMFCILPIAKGLVNIASQSIDCTAQSVIKVLENPDQLNLQVLKARIDHQFQKLRDSMGRSNLKFNSTASPTPVL